MKPFNPPGPFGASAQSDNLEGQVGLALAAQLSRGCETLPHGVDERLRFARERALAAASQRRRATSVQGATAWLGSGGGSAVLGGEPPSVWWRLASVLPLVMLVAGLLFIRQHYEWQQIEVAADVDSALLADDLPPSAYGDPGFLEYLRNADSR